DNNRKKENLVSKINVLNDPKAFLTQNAVHKTDIHITQATAKTSSLKRAARVASDRTERQLILEALARTCWNRKRAAQELQISYKSLLNKLKQIRIEEQQAILSETEDD